MEFSKRKVFRWSKKAEIALMREVVALRPSAPSQWHTVAPNVTSALQVQQQAAGGSQISGRAAKDHAKVVMRNFSTEESRALKTSGTEEEFGELCQLCQDIQDYERDAKEKEKEPNKKKLAEGDNRVGLQMRDAAMKRLGEKQDHVKPKKRRTSGIEELTALLSANQELKAKELELEERRMALREKEVENNRILMVQQMELIRAMIEAKK